MKAKLVENIEFERGQEPSKAMGIGGFSFEKMFQRVQDAINEYAELLKKTLAGETIFVDTALITSEYTNTTIKDVKFNIESVYATEYGDIIAEGSLLEVNDDRKKTISSEQKIDELPAKCQIYIRKTEKIMLE